MVRCDELMLIGAMMAFLSLEQAATNLLNPTDLSTHGVFGATKQNIPHAPSTFFELQR
jgi:hypothetical protein